jgi:hypothetical protein
MEIFAAGESGFDTRIHKNHFLFGNIDEIRNISIDWPDSAIRIE